MPIISTEVQYRLSGGAANADPLLSLGGAKSGTLFGANFFDDVTSAQSAAGSVEFRCLYVHNNNATLIYQNAVIWIQANTPSADTTLDIGIGTSAINGIEAATATEVTVPTGVTFSAPAAFAAGLVLGSLPAGQHRAVWVRRTVNPGAAAINSDTYTLRVQGDTAA